MNLFSYVDGVLILWYLYLPLHSTNDNFRFNSPYLLKNNYFLIERDCQEEVIPILKKSGPSLNFFRYLRLKYILCKLGNMITLMQIPRPLMTTYLLLVIFLLFQNNSKFILYFGRVYITLRSIYILFNVHPNFHYLI